MISTRTHWGAVSAIAGMAVALSVVAAPTASARVEPVAPAPSAEDLVSATNAMLDGFVWSKALTTGPDNDSQYTTGFTNPPGGQDPLPACVYGAGPGSTSVEVPDTGAVGFSAESGFLTQDVYQYGSEELAKRAWQKLSRGIGDHCSGTWSRDGASTTLTRTRLAAIAGGERGWAVATKAASYVRYSALHRVGDAIQMVSYSRESGRLGAAVPTALNALARRLAARWTDRATAANRQGPLLTGAQMAMLTTADIPTTLPVTSPTQGGWSGFSANEPGSEFFTCASQANLPPGTWTMSSSRGGLGDVYSGPGEIDQTINTYQTDDAAALAWRRLRRAVLGCNDPTPARISQTRSVRRISSGVSALSFSGVPGVWSRELDTYPGSEGTCSTNSGTVVPCPDFSTKAYTIYLLLGSDIQALTYYTTRDAVGEIPLDQLAVNVLAEQLAHRWNTTMQVQDEG